MLSRFLYISSEKSTTTKLVQCNIKTGNHIQYNRHIVMSWVCLCQITIWFVTCYLVLLFVWHGIQLMGCNVLLVSLSPGGPYNSYAFLCFDRTNHHLRAVLIKSKHVFLPFSTRPSLYNNLTYFGQSRLIANGLFSVLGSHRVGKGLLALSRVRMYSVCCMLVVSACARSNLGTGNKKIKNSGQRKVRVHPRITDGRWARSRWLLEWRLVSLTECLMRAMGVLNCTLV